MLVESQPALQAVKWAGPQLADLRKQLGEAVSKKQRDKGVAVGIKLLQNNSSESIKNLLSLCSLPDIEQLLSALSYDRSILSEDNSAGILKRVAQTWRGQASTPLAVKVFSMLLEFEYEQEWLVKSLRKERLELKPICKLVAATGVRSLGYFKCVSAAYPSRLALECREDLAIIQRMAEEDIQVREAGKDQECIEEENQTILRF